MITEDDAKKVGAAIVAGLLDAIGGAPRAEPEKPAVEPRWMTIDAYAKRSGFARSTIQRAIAAGMPHVTTSRGARVEVAAADEWIRAGGMRAL